MTREELVKQKAQEVTSSGEFSPSLTECFIAGAEWEHKRLVKKACEWLKEQDEMVGVSFEEDFIDRFKNYMKGE